MGKEITVLFGDDANMNLYFAGTPAESTQIDAYVSRLAGKADILAWDCVVNGVCWYQSERNPNIWEGRKGHPTESIKMLCDNIKALSLSGSNPPLAVAEACHKHGMKMLAGIRMGLAIHDDSFMRSESGVYWNRRMTTDFLDRTYEDRSLSLEAPGSRASEASRNLDFTYKEVRELILGPCRELAEGFPIDGFELNFIRGGIPFESYEAESKAYIITDLVGEIRSMLDISAKRQSKGRLILAVRVPCDIDFCRRMGFDIKSWLDKDYIDIIAPDTVHRMINDAPIDSFINIRGDRNVKVLPSLHPCPGENEPRALYRAVLDNAYRHGADGFSTFNLSGHFFHPYDGNMLDWFEEFRNPERVAAGEKMFSILRRTVPQDDLYNIQLEYVSFKKHELNIRKPVRFPRIMAFNDDGIEKVLKFKARDWSCDDELIVDIDNDILPGVMIQRSIPAFYTAVISGGKDMPQFIDPKAGSEYEWGTTYSFEVSIPSRSGMSEIGFTMARRADITRDAVIKDISIVLADKCHQNEQGESCKQ